MLSADILLQVLWTSVANASYQAVLAVAFALVLKVMQIWDFTQPALVGVAFYTMYVLASWFGVPVVLAVLITAIPVVGLAVGIERLAFQTLRDRQSEILSFFIFSLIFAEFVVFLLTLIFTTAPTFMLPNMMSPIHIVGGVVVSDWDLIAIVVSVTLILSLWLFLRFTRQGQYLIAVANNADLAEVYGIDKTRCYRLTMAIVGILVVGATYLAGTKLAFFPELPVHLMVFSVAATILGGIGNVFAAAIAAVFISVIQQASVLVIEARWQPLIVFGILFAVILFFPKGVRWRAKRLSRGPSPAAAASGTG
jgi:branched-subunit amino acid ABC-type transport system permease component